jgi:hypothetical protein
MSESLQLDEDPNDQLAFDQEPLELENLMLIENPTQDPAAEAADRCLQFVPLGRFGNAL